MDQQSHWTLDSKFKLLRGDLPSRIQILKNKNYLNASNPCILEGRVSYAEMVASQNKDALIVFFCFLFKFTKNIIEPIYNSK